MTGTRSRLARWLLLACAVVTLSGGCSTCRDCCDDDEYHDDYYEHEVDHRPANESR